MKRSILTALLGLLLGLGLADRDDNLYQVVTAHDHDLEELAPYINTVYQNGRLWVVEVREDIPKLLKTHLKPLTGREKSYHYRGNFLNNMSKRLNPFNIRHLLSKVDVNALKKDVIVLSNFENRYVGTEGNSQAVELVSERFKKLGFSVEKKCYAQHFCNLVAEKRGSKKSDEVIMTMGHIDSVGEEFAGADDNGSGIAVMLEMARILKDYPNNKTIQFFISNGEELGYVGSDLHVRELAQSNELKRISLAINMDMVGFNSNGVVELETDPAFGAMAQWLADLASEYTTLKTKISLGAWGSDHVPFLRAGIPAILTVENWDTKNPCYHAKCDRPDTLNYNYMTEVAKLNLSAILEKDLSP